MTRLVALAAFMSVTVWAVEPHQEPAGARTDLTFTPVTGTWRTAVVDGQTTLTADGAVPPQLPGAFPLALVREVTDFKQGRIRVQFKLIAGASDQAAGIVFNHKPDGRYHFARYNTKDGNVALWTFDKGTRTVLSHGEVHEQLALNQWHDLTLTVRDRTVTVVASENGAGHRVELRAAHTLDGPVQGRIGFWTKGDSVTAFRRLVVERD